MTKGNQFRSPFGGANAGNPRDFKRISFGISFYSSQRAGIHFHQRTRGSLAQRGRLAGNIRHADAAGGIVMREFLPHAVNSARSQKSEVRSQNAQLSAVSYQLSAIRRKPLADS
jgi:hypothetical protein